MAYLNLVEYLSSLVLVLVMPEHEVLLKAGTNIELENGFSIPQNSNVKIDISPCD